VTFAARPDAGVAELVDVADLKSAALGRVGSKPTARTRTRCGHRWDPVLSAWMECPTAC
jgi:hypothetical protein